MEKYTIKDLLMKIRKRNNRNCLKGYSRLRKKQLYDFVEDHNLIEKEIPRAKGREGKKEKKELFSMEAMDLVNKNKFKKNEILAYINLKKETDKPVKRKDLIREIKQRYPVEGNMLKKVYNYFKRISKYNRIQKF